VKIVFNYARNSMPNRIASSLKSHGYKLTQQRKIVMDVIESAGGHLTPGEIYARVHRDHSTIGLVTIYRTLEVLADLKLICRVHGEDGCHSYLMRRPNGHHHHVVCSSCGAVADFTRCDIEALERKISRQTGFKIRSHLLEFEGLCQKCLDAESL